MMFRLLIVAMISVLVAALGASRSAQVQEPGAGWEYRIFQPGTPADVSSMARDINNIGREGWELVSVIRVSDSTDRFYFKRVRR